MAEKKEMKKESSRTGMLIVGGLLIGIGIGLLFNQPGVGALVGLGIGFLLAFAFSRNK
jgi:uncharacterized membrane protein